MKLFLLTLFFASSGFAHALEGTSLKEITQSLTVEDRDQFEQGLTEAGISIPDAQEVRVTHEEGAEGRTLTLLINENSPLPPQHVLYLGVRLGLLFPYGVESIYQYQVNGLTRFHADAGVTTSHFFHSIEMGGAWHPRDGRAFYVGLRAKDAILFNSDRGYRGIFDPYQADHFFSVGPEVGWQKTMGRKKIFLGTISLGAQKAFGQDFNLPLMPEIRLGIAVRIFKH